MEQTEHGGGEGSAIERRGDPKGGRCPRLISPERASDLAQGDCANELGLPSRKTARKIAAPLARDDGSHNAQSHRREWTH